jgi:hypothetical protein
MYKLTDFKQGQTVWVELTGNANRYKNDDELIEEWEVISVGKKYVTAKRKNGGYEVKFKETDLNYDGLIQNTQYCVDYILYPSKEEISNKFEKEELVDWIKKQFSGYGRKSKYSLEQLRKVKEILDSKLN